MIFYALFVNEHDAKSQNPQQGDVLPPVSRAKLGFFALREGVKNVTGYVNIDWFRIEQ